MSKKIKTKYTYDNVTGLRCGSVKFHRKKIHTPIKAVGLKILRNNYPMNEEIRGINEIYQTFPGKTKYNKYRKPWKIGIEDYRNDGAKNTGLTNRLNTLMGKADHDREATICFMGFEGQRYPDKDELRFLTTRGFGYSTDVVPFPILTDVAKFVDIDNYSKYIDFLDRALEELEIRNEKPLMGIIPIKLGQVIVEEIMKFYINNNVTAFCVDFNASSVSTKYPDIIDIYKTINDYDIDGDGFLYSINASVGRASQKKSVIDAKDILSFGYGFDVLGKFQSPPIPIDAAQKFNTSDKRLRVFNKEDYGYYKVIGSDIKKIYPKGSGVPLDDLIKIKVKTSPKGNTYLDRSISNHFNMEQQGLEAHRLYKIIKNDEAKKYIDKKLHIDNRDKKKIFTMRYEIDTKQRTFDF